MEVETPGLKIMQDSKNSHSRIKKNIEQPTILCNCHYVYKLDEGSGLIRATCPDLTHQHTSSKSGGLTKLPNGEPGALTGPANTRHAPHAHADQCNDLARPAIDADTTPGSSSTLHMTTSHDLRRVPDAPCR